MADVRAVDDAEGASGVRELEHSRGWALIDVIEGSRRQGESRRIRVSSRAQDDLAAARALGVLTLAA